MNGLNLDQLTPEQLLELEGKIAVAKAEKAKQIAAERENYKTLVTDSVKEHIVSLISLSQNLSKQKAAIYDTFATIIRLKSELYGSKSGQQSHTFSDEDGNTITVGFRTIDNFDDTLDMGIAKVREYLESLAVDAKTSKLIDMINRLLKKDAKGNLKPSRILDLQNLADKEQDPLLTEGVIIIRESYKPQRSAIFIEAETRDAEQKRTSIPLSITSVEFPEDYEPDFEVFK